MIAHFFIDRPVFAWVVAILIMLAGGISVFRLPVAQFPNVAPPTISINATYSGASAKTLEDTVTQVIEQKLNGIDGLLYMTSGSSSTGRLAMRLTFDSSVDPDTAQMQVQNKLQLAMPSLPDEIKRSGVTVNKVASDTFLQRFAFVSEDGTMSASNLADFVASVIQDPLSRIPGVGAVTLDGSQYAMRIWLDPNRLLAYKMTPSDIVQAISAQNTQISVGQIGASPIIEGQQINVTINARKKLSSIDEFTKILLRVNTDGSIVRLGDVARVELGRESYSSTARYNGKPSAGVGIQLASGANALQTAANIATFLEQMRPNLPQGVSIATPYDSIPFVTISIHEVAKTLFEAICLVFIIIYLFLQNFRATLIPTIAVPVVLLGTFGVMAAFGFSINTMTLFGLVLAIGLLVDDAIVVVENVVRIMREKHLSPRDATYESMHQITGALVGVAVVLTAVFAPMAFFNGVTGVIYRQFALTIASSILLSVVVALVLTPALCATLLKPTTTVAQQGFWGWFNRSFDHATRRYQGVVLVLLRRKRRMILIYGVIIAAMGWLFVQMPTGFLPNEDQGLMSVQIVLPAGATEEETLKVAQRVERYFLENEKDTVEGLLMTIGDGGGNSRGQNTAQASVRLRHWNDRPKATQSVLAVMARAQTEFSQIIDARVRVSAPPAIRGMGNASGFALELEDRSGLGHTALIDARDKLLSLAAQNPLLSNVRSSSLDDTPQLQINIDDHRAGAFGLSLDSVNANLATAWGGSYVNDFIDRSRVKRVYVQADANFRMSPDDLKLWYFRNQQGNMVPFDAFATADWTYGPSQLERYNGFSSDLISGVPAQGVSSGTAMQEMANLVRQLPGGFGYEWTGVSFQESLTGTQTPFLYAFSILVVFLALAALYESWSVPLAVILVVPLGVIGALMASGMRGLANDVYFQVGLLAVVGLSAKNAILIVEFAKELHSNGMTLLQSAVEAARLRLRPIVMTSLAFLIGVLPLVMSRGAGSGSQHAIGTGVVGGTLMATALGIFYIPLFFVVVTGFFAESCRSTGGTLKSRCAKLLQKFHKGVDA
ncbi:MAG: efflux RND transporter permease subunit [Desulfovibrio desulfuricans]|nr:efflux RND transporter permease subunit [Desulfovibrio desulfuricans]